MSEAAVKALFTDAERDLGLDKGALTLDEEGQAFFRIDDDGPIISLDYLDSQDLLVFSVMLERPADGDEAYRTLLRANHLWGDTGGATLSLNPETDQPVLMRSAAPADLSADEFIAALEEMTDLGAHFNGILAAADGDDVNAGDNDAPMPGAGDFIRG